MKKSISHIGKQLDKHSQQSITGGSACFYCYDNCILTSKDRIELGDCYDSCQIYHCS